MKDKNCIKQFLKSSTNKIPSNGSPKSIVKIAPAIIAKIIRVIPWAVNPL